MKTIYVVQNDNETPMMAFNDEQSAKYVSRTNYSASCVIYPVTLIEYDCATDIVKRPTPKVLDADGVEIKVGDTVYEISNGRERKVFSPHGHGEVTHDRVDCYGFYPKPNELTHEKPVFDAEGVRICKDDTVWFLHGDQHSFIVDRVFKDINGFLIAEVGSDGEETYYHPKNLTHREPDSLEKLLSDMMEDRRMCGSSYIPRIQRLIERGA